MPTYNELKAQKRAIYELTKRIKKHYRLTGQGVVPTKMIDGKPYVEYSKYTKL